MDDMCIVFVNTTALQDNPRYRVYSPNVMHTCSTLQEVADLIRPCREEGKKLRGVGFGNTHNCALYPADEAPNFAGNNCIGQWDSNNVQVPREVLYCFSLCCLIMY